MPEKHVKFAEELAQESTPTGSQHKVTKEALSEWITFIRRKETHEKSDYGKRYMDAIRDCFSAFEIIHEQ